MAITSYLAEAIIREHKYKRIHGDVLLLGRQTMRFSLREAVTLIRGYGLAPDPIPLDETVLDRKTLGSQGHEFIRDDAFFRLLGVNTVRAIDHSDYEGAEIIHNLNEPISDGLEATADFILDGSTLDNLFDPATAIKSMARMLRPGGRLIAINLGSTLTGRPYSICSPYWFLDYFAINQFKDCRVYVIIYGWQHTRVLAVDPSSKSNITLPIRLFSNIFVFAEKDNSSTWDRIPDQREYAGRQAHEAYSAAAYRFETSDRPQLVVSSSNHFTPPLLSRVIDHAINTLQMAEISSMFFKLIGTDGQSHEITMRWRFRILGRLRRWIKMSLHRV